ncbi:MAG TPA: CocE/NonD family hydrolase, partial [Ktedonobacterales bacterium]|nr:CocE/NonD family hydrolase [Ktedonobacterales bacterium]
MMITTADTPRIAFGIRVPMRDGVTLAADVYLPPLATGESDRWPIILNRTPYLKSNEAFLDNARYYTGQGYALVAMDVRGRGDSDGIFVPY